MKLLSVAAIFFNLYVWNQSRLFFHALSFLQIVFGTMFLLQMPICLSYHTNLQISKQTIETMDENTAWLEVKIHHGFIITPLFAAILSGVQYLRKASFSFTQLTEIDA